MDPTAAYDRWMDAVAAGDLDEARCAAQDLLTWIHVKKGFTPPDRDICLLYVWVAQWIAPDDVTETQPILPEDMPREIGDRFHDFALGILRGRWATTSASTRELLEEEAGYVAQQLSRALCCRVHLITKEIRLNPNDPHLLSGELGVMINGHLVLVYPRRPMVIQPELTAAEEMTNGA